MSDGKSGIATGAAPEKKDVASSAEQEIAAQSAWLLLPQHQGLRLFDDLARSEFFDFDRQQAQADHALSAMVRFAVEKVPFYRDYFVEHGLNADDVRHESDLKHLPVLDKDTVIAREQSLHAETLPENEKWTWTTYSSGTTGKRTRVRMTHRANMMFTILVLRQYRWFRFDLSGSLAQILAPRNFADPLDDHPPYDFQEDRDHWTYASTFFETGPSYLLSSAQPLEIRQAWLEQKQPGYLASDPATLEEHAFSRPSGPVASSLKGVLGTSSQMTPLMRHRIERSFQVPVNQNYGANEIGIIALRCGAGRYHVQQEHCLVEITDRHGEAVGPGQQGRILVTGLSNFAMPLFRYELGDLATVPVDPCPCGRTQKSFTDIEGRFRRWHNVPPDTHRKYRVITDALQSIAPEYLTAVRAYQLHLFIDRRLEFRIQSGRALPPQVRESILREWLSNYPDCADQLEIVRVEQFDIPPNGKLAEFTSDFPDEPFST
ncbi:MAG: phenylacetate--CoA ligase family protein [Xanthomonadales bacterium]|nr:hypothetical protein [Gammaproteobacteria bacterium]NNL94492.1 phenylacetate--CoA ligase family protein [Xanthomonadales bacterium]